MSPAPVGEGAISLGQAGELRLSGVLDYRSGPALRKQGQALINGNDAPSLVIDCSAVLKSSSVGLSLLLAFMRDAAAAGKALTVCNLPDDMQKIAKVSELTELLPIH